MRAIIAIMGILLILSGCPRTGSEFIATGGLYIEYTVVENGERADVRAEVVLGGRFGAPVELSAGDEISVNGTILGEGGFLDTGYNATVVAADEYVFRFTRPNESPYVSTVKPAVPVTITSPTDGATVSRLAGFTVSWEMPTTDPPMDDGLSVGFISANCASYTSMGPTDGENVYTFTSDQFYSTVNDEEGNPTDQRELFCPEDTAWTMYVTSWMSGTMDPALNGTVTCGAQTSVSLTMLP